MDVKRTPLNDCGKQDASASANENRQKGLSPSHGNGHGIPLAGIVTGTAALWATPRAQNTRSGKSNLHGRLAGPLTAFGNAIVPQVAAAFDRQSCRPLGLLAFVHRGHDKGRTYRGHAARPEDNAHSYGDDIGV